MNEKMLFLKYHDITVGLLTVEDNIPKQLEILRPDLFFDKHRKNILFGNELIEWIKDRVRPNAQVGLNKILESLGIDDSASMWYWELFLKTKGMNVKDRLWISENEFDNSPWDLLLTIDKEISTVYGNSEDMLKYVVRQLKNELVDKPFAGKIKEEFLEDIFKPYEKEIMEFKGTNYKDIIKWIMDMYNHILDQFKKISLLCMQWAYFLYTFIVKK